jgi:hypothetical protein
MAKSLLIAADEAADSADALPFGVRQWSYCYVDEVGRLIPQERGATAIAPSPLAAELGART